MKHDHSPTQLLISVGKPFALAIMQQRQSVIPLARKGSVRPGVLWIHYNSRLDPAVPGHAPKDYTSRARVATDLDDTIVGRVTITDVVRREDCQLPFAVGPWNAIIHPEGVMWVRQQPDLDERCEHLRPGSVLGLGLDDVWKLTHELESPEMRTRRLYRDGVAGPGASVDTAGD